MQQPQIAAVHHDVAAAHALADDVGHERPAVAEAGVEVGAIYSDSLQARMNRSSD
jgi:hypothetical protein